MTPRTFVSAVQLKLANRERHGTSRGASPLQLDQHDGGIITSTQQQRVWFGAHFMDDYAGSIVRDPKIALVELVANAWDAGAATVVVSWPTEDQPNLEVVDNGHGMTLDQFELRWRTLAYQRRHEQGEFAQDLAGLPTSRRAFGRSGKGRHGALCFGDEYVVQSWRDGVLTQARVRRSADPEVPFEIEQLPADVASGHGTRVLVRVTRFPKLSVDQIREALGARFLLDPSFALLVNGEQVTLTDISNIVKLDTVVVPGVGEIQVHRIDAPDGDRSTRHHGIAWWVNKRLVGDWSWDTLARPGRFLDGRTSEARRYTFIVEADVLEADVQADWSEFQETERVERTRSAVDGHIENELKLLLRDSRHDRKQRALSPHIRVLEQMPTASREQVSEFVSEVVEHCPTVSDRDLTHMVDIMANLEKARSRFYLLEQLAQVSPEELDTVSEILAKWSVRDAIRVLDELDWRLKLITEMEALVGDPKTDELHQLLPLFERGLWIFGPEFESVHFRANRTISTVLRDLLDPHSRYQSSRRPDFVILPDRSLGVWSHPKYDEHGEEHGPARVVVVELKRGGFTITRKEVNQAQEYIDHLRRSGKLRSDTQVDAFVLGAQVDDVVKPYGDGMNFLKPMAYTWLLGRAHSRTFNLSSELRSTVDSTKLDPVAIQSEIDL